MRQRTDEHQVEQLRDDQREDRDLHRRADVLLGVEPRRQHFDHDNPKQTDRVSDQRALSHQGIVCVELPVLEQRHRQWLGEDSQGQRARQHQHEAQAQAPIENARVFMAVLARVSTRQRRQQNRAQGHAEDAGRQLHQAIGVVHPRHRTGHQQ